MLRVLIFSALVLVISTEGCRPPLQWEGDLGTNTGFSKEGQGYLAQGQMRMSVDANLAKVAVIGAISINGKYMKQQQLQDYKQGILYVVNDGKCEKSSLPPGNPFVNPEPGKEVAEGYYGLLGRNSLNFTTYEMPYPGPFFQGKQYMSLSPDCVPIGQIIVGDGVMTVNGYYNIKPGVKDPSVFDVPKECLKTIHAPIVPI